jgi:hypothetical protein
MDLFSDFLWAISFCQYDIQVKKNGQKLDLVKIRFWPEDDFPKKRFGLKLT